MHNRLDNNNLYAQWTKYEGKQYLYITPPNFKMISEEDVQEFEERL